MNTASIISRVWSFCTTLRDDGVGYGDYLEQLTYLIFLKMADEYSKPPYNRYVGIPDEYSWPALKSKKGAELEVLYVELLRELGREGNAGADLHQGPEQDSGSSQTLPPDDPYAKLQLFQNQDVSDEYVKSPELQLSSLR